MVLHILNGDALAQKFNLEGEILICREAFVVGRLATQTNEAIFWQYRIEAIAYLMQYTNQAFDNEKYNQKVKKELEKLQKASDYQEITFWFDTDVFCQINQFVLLNYILQSSHQSPTFSFAHPDKVRYRKYDKVWDSRRFFTEQDLEFIQKLWQLYTSNDMLIFWNLLQSEFPKNLIPLQTALMLNIQRFPNPITGLNVLEKKILNYHGYHLSLACEKFIHQHQAWGWGDSQFYALLHRLKPLLKEHLLQSEAQMIALNENASQVLSGKKNFLDFQPQKEWIGGARKDQFAWDEIAQTLIKLNEL